MGWGSGQRIVMACVVLVAAAVAVAGGVRADLELLGVGLDGDTGAGGVTYGVLLALMILAHGFLPHRAR